MDKFILNYCSCATDNKSKHVIENHAHDILSSTLRPIFQKHVASHPTLTKRSEPKYASVADNDLHDNQLWKNDDYVEILIWIVQEISPRILEDNLQLIIPPVLIVLDDYDIPYKEQGVKMVHKIIRKLEPKNISVFGLDNVFFDSLIKCLSYLSEDRDVNLLKSTYPCILDLIATKKDILAQTRLYERVLKDGIINGFIYAGHRIKFLPILLQPLPVLFEKLGIISAQYLKAIIPVTCDSMSMLSRNNLAIKDINSIAARVLISAIKTCWPRIPSYRGIIMKAIAKSWMYYSETEDNMMCELIREVYQMFEAACQGQEKADKEALMAFKPTVFSKLFT